MSQLPPELWGEILSHLSPEEVARALATNSSFKEGLSISTQEALELRRDITLLKKELAQKALADTKLELKYYKTELFEYTLASPEFTELLGPSFPRYKGRAIVRGTAVLNWLKVYLEINQLYDEESKMYKVDPAISQLTGLPEGTEEELTDIFTILRMKDHYRDLPDTSLDIRDLEKVIYIEKYLRNLATILIDLRSRARKNILTPESKKKLGLYYERPNTFIRSPR